MQFLHNCESNRCEMAFFEWFWRDENWTGHGVSCHFCSFALCILSCSILILNVERHKSLSTPCITTFFSPLLYVECWSKLLYLKLYKWELLSTIISNFFFDENNKQIRF